MFKKGDEVEAKVLQIDSESERFSLGIKQLSADPFIKAVEDLAPGSKAKGKVIKVTEFGAFVEIAPGVEGLVHISELSDEEGAKAESVVKEDEEIEFVVLSSDSEERKFSLSRKALVKQLEGEELKQYISEVAEPKTGLADAFAKAKSALEAKESEPKDSE